MVGANDFPTLIQELHSELNQDGERWQRAHEIVRGKLDSPTNSSNGRNAIDTGRSRSRRSWAKFAQSQQTSRTAC